MKVLTLILLLCYTHYCYGNNQQRLSKRESSNEQSLIQGGGPVVIRVMPYMGQLRIMFFDLTEKNCSSTILSTKALLTAARCLKGSAQISEIRISIGSDDINTGVYYRAYNYTIHPKYRFPDPLYDVAVVLVVNLILDGKHAKPVELSLNRPITNGAIFVAGWGITQMGQLPGSNTALKAVKLKLIYLSKCQRSLGKAVPITSQAFCAVQIRKEPSSPCVGDEGGPALTLSGLQVGITSLAPGCGTTSLPSVFTSIAFLRTWIREAAGV